MVRGRTITLSALSLLAIYTLFSREPQSAAGSQQAPAIPAGADDDDPAPDDGDPLTDGEAEVLAALNSTELRERLSRRKFRRKLQPMSWRHNRKKMTELTSITSVKDPNAKPPAEPESHQYPPKPPQCHHDAHGPSGASGQPVWECSVLVGAPAQGVVV